jgi:hypothetical protein
MLNSLLILLALGGGQQGPGSIREPLRPLEFLVGSCWTGTFPGGKATASKRTCAVVSNPAARTRPVKTRRNDFICASPLRGREC